MTIDETLAVKKTPEQLAAEQAQAEADLAEWYDQKQRLEALKESEMDLRNKVVQYYFPKGLKEGTNKADLPEGWILNVKGTINRKIDVSVKDQVAKELKDEFQMDAGEFIKYKPDLDLPAYRELVKAVQAATGERKEKAEKCLKLFESLLIITDGSPQVELVAPKKPKAKVSV